LLERTTEHWNEFTSQRHDFDSLLPQSTPLRNKLLRTIDDVTVNIKTQQGQQGSVLAGHFYHLGYVRDMYGVSRCLLKLGYFEQAKAILDFYWNIWQRHGRIYNAQGIGVDGLFHIHENDDVEITGYLIMQTFDYAERTGNKSAKSELHTYFPMLEWACQVQTRHLVEQMLPFNGDETYIAGGVLPRSAMNDGSAEATLLFITAGQKLLKWIDDHDKWPKDKLARAVQTLEQTKARYHENFWRDGNLIANNPARAVAAILPRFRFGICEATGMFGWTEKNKNDRYISPLAGYGPTLSELPAAESKKYHLQSVCLLPLYIGSPLISRRELADTISTIAEQYQKTGRLPSRPSGDVTVGYDYGFLLQNLIEINHPLAADVYEKMLAQLDSVGAWVEYYENGQPKGCRYRPWESAINLEAALYFATKQ